MCFPESNSIECDCEILGHVALLEEFNNVCKTGLIATFELAELTRIKVPASIDPKHTITRNVHTNLSNQFGPTTNEIQTTENHIMYDGTDCKLNKYGYLFFIYTASVTIFGILLVIHCKFRCRPVNHYSNSHSITQIAPANAPLPPMRNSARNSRESMNRLRSFEPNDARTTTVKTTAEALSDLLARVPDYDRE